MHDRIVIFRWTTPLTFLPLKVIQTLDFACRLFSRRLFEDRENECCVCPEPGIIRELLWKCQFHLEFIMERILTCASALNAPPAHFWKWKYAQLNVFFFFLSLFKYQIQILSYSKNACNIAYKQLTNNMEIFFQHKYFTLKFRGSA